MSTQHFKSDKSMSMLNLKVFVSTALLTMATNAYANTAVSAETTTARSNHELQQPIQLVQSFVETMDYQLLSAPDKAVWDKETWNEIQANAERANQVRLPDHHPFYELERLARAHVTILAIDAERAEDGSVRVITEMTYPYILMLVDEYVETDSSFAYEQLREINQTMNDDALDVGQFEVYRSTMPWRVHDGGVFVDAAQMQKNRESLQAQGW